MVETSGQKVSEDKVKPTTLEVEIHRCLFHNENREEFETDWNGTRRLASESTSVEQ